jgi:hypothetical protein
MIVLSRATQNTAVHKAKMQSARGVPDKCADPTVVGSFEGASSEDSADFSAGGSTSGVDILEDCKGMCRYFRSCMAQLVYVPSCMAQLIHAPSCRWLFSIETYPGR